MVKRWKKGVWYGRGNERARARQKYSLRKREREGQRGGRAVTRKGNAMERARPKYSAKAGTRGAAKSKVCGGGTKGAVMAKISPCRKCGRGRTRVYVMKNSFAWILGRRRHTRTAALLAFPEVVGIGRFQSSCILCGIGYIYAERNICVERNKNAG